MCCPAGKWRADWKFSLVSPPVPRWSRERPVKILKGEMMMFLLGSSSVRNKSVRKPLLALRGADERQKVQEIQEAKPNSIILFLRPRKP